MLSQFSIQKCIADEFIKERERYATIGDDLDQAFVELIGVETAYNDRHPKPPTPKMPTPPPAPPKEPTPPGRHTKQPHTRQRIDVQEKMCSFRSSSRLALSVWLLNGV